MNYTGLNSQTAVCLQHISDKWIYLVLKQCFCECMNLNFKLFVFLKAQTYFERKVM